MCADAECAVCADAECAVCADAECALCADIAMLFGRSVAPDRDVEEDAELVDPFTTIMLVDPFTTIMQS